MGKAKEFEYKAEMKQLLNLIVHSLYKNPDIFLRELVSNASDALNKIRFRKLTDTNIIDPDSELTIKIIVDKEKHTFSIEDSGIGMTQEDLVKRIGTVASSGTMEFLKKAQEEKKSIGSDLIGKFGVGFYSSFMVTDKITIETLHADLNSKAYKWQSKDEDKFLIDEMEKNKRGTVISFKLQDEHKEFADPERIKTILQKYSNFVDFPIYLNGEEVNKVTALWQRKKDEIKKEELNEFYKFISNDYQEPLGHLQISIEGKINFKALLFIPKSAPASLFSDSNDKSLHLYSSRIFIQDDCKELLPEYLKFVKGVVDTEDLPLNVSREVTQSSPLLTKIRTVITGKILSLFEDWAENNKEKFNEFYSVFSSLFKMGLNSDFSNKDRITELMRYETSALEKGKMKSLKEYVSTMADGQNEIYYLLGEHRDLIEKNPNLEYFQKKGIEVIYLTDPVDVFTFSYINSYDSKSLKSIEKSDINLSKDDEASKESLEKDKSSSLIDYFKTQLGDKVEDVIESKRLVDSAVTLVVGAQGLDPQTEKMMQYMDKNFSAGKKIFEINISHPLIKNLSRIYEENKDSDILKSAILQLFEGALLMEGKLSSPSDYVKRMTNILERATIKK